MIPGLVAIVIMMRQEKAMTDPETAVPVEVNTDPTVDASPEIPDGFIGDDPAIVPGDAVEDVTPDTATEGGTDAA
jgi:hypothetical protein